MTGFHTRGFDAVLELSENTVSRLLSPLAEVLLPLWCNVNNGNFTNIATDAGAASGNCQFQNITGSSSVDLDTEVPNGIDLLLSFSIQVSFTSPAAWRNLGAATFDGMLRIIAQAGIDRTWGSRRCFILDFNGVTSGRVEIVSLNLPSGMEGWEPHRGTLQAWLEEHVIHSLQDFGSEDFNRLLCRDIDPEDPDPDVATDVNVTVTMNGAVRSLAILTKMFPGSEGEAEDFTTSALSPGDDVALVLSNRLLLQERIGQRIAEDLAIPDTSTPDATDILDADDLFELDSTRCTLRDEQDIFHLIPTDLAKYIEEASLRDASIWVNDDQEIHVTLDIWIGFWSGVFFSRTGIHFWGTIEPMPGVNNQAVIHWRVEVPNTSIYAGPAEWVLLSLLGPILNGLAVRPLVNRSIWGIMDDWFSPPDFTIAGTTVWPDDPVPLDIDYAVDLSDFLPFPLQIDDIIVDDLAMIGRAELPEPAFELPEPRLMIVGDWTAGDPAITGIRAGWSPTGTTDTIITISQQHSGDFQALSQRILLPIEHFWSLGDHELSGSGRIEIEGAEVDYTVNGDRCQLSLHIGVSLDSVLTVSGIDPFGQEWYATPFEFSVKGSEELHGFAGVELLEGPMAGLPESYVEQEPSPAESTVTVSAAVSTSTAVGETVVISDCAQMIRTALLSGMGIDTSNAGLRRGGP